MKILQIEIKDVPHCPRNRSHTLTLGKGKRGVIPMNIKTEAARAYEDAIRQDLEANYIQETALFAGAFDPKKHCLEAIWELHSPDVMTKDGRISQNGTDLDAHKVLQDTIMGFLGIDDAYIVRDTRTKIQGDYLVRLDLRIKEIQK